ncbi:hypothetical protein EJ03DRAFT_348668 [Teratosphaeria nubilosa]|uniref:[histone H3]-trimethyl-L-lysine(9) demethylase n=1 Tax=Teratosphaeria nubilosa TaxID=161662 RepID=A0A6G1LHD4_9PEZI|nr:hypothetical protein EJ03DRAFT_348668 [Teratosphaeria nubilosa]
MAAPGSPLTDTMDTSAPLSPEPHDIKPTTHSVAKPTNALTPPTSEEMNHDAKHDADESELSDIDDIDIEAPEPVQEQQREPEQMEEDDEEEIEPDHYWDGGKIPVFMPTMNQFRDFKRFCERIDHYGMKSGIVKVIPPKEWRDARPPLDDYVKRIKIKNPITQEFNGASGTYTQQNVEKQRSYNLPEWKALTEETHHQPPAKRGERRRNQAQVVRGGGSLRGRAAANAAAATADPDAPPPEKRKPGRPRRAVAPVAPPAESESENEEPAPKRSRGKASPAPKAAKSKSEPKARGGRQPRGGQAKSVSSRRLNNTGETQDVIDEKAFKSFDYRMEGLDEFTPERCQELETQYWKSLAFNQPMYAADMPGSLFDDKTTSWNVAHLPNLLDILGTKVPGVNTAYLYMGMWKATFAWHLEDVDLYSINYIHFGAPKQWYSISQEDARKFEAAMKQVWPVDAKNCDQFLRHKTYLISPEVLEKQYKVKVNKLVHYEGEFVITYPYGYHSGYNLGYNCAESVNFALDSWIEFGRIARKCNCEADNVWVDVAEIERKLRGEPTPEYYEETDDDDDDLSDVEENALPTPPASVKGKARRGQKRKREVKEEKPKKKKIRIRIKVAGREPCILCPNENPWEPLLNTDTGKKTHRSCALFTPETWIGKDAADNEIVYGVNSIDKARLELKCNFCRSKRGACFQCHSKKCTRAFHATCAQAAGVLIDGGLVPTWDEDGTEYYEEGFDFRCKYHRPKMVKNPNFEDMESSKLIKSYAKALKPNDVVQAQYKGEDVFGALVVENRPAELTVLVKVLPDLHELLEVEYKYICVLNPADSVRPKPTPSALPMPEGMNRKAVSMENRQDGVPEQGDVFHDNPDYKVHDFYNLHEPPPSYASTVLQTAQRLKVNIDAPDQMYYYLPFISTEAKSFFADRPGGQVANKANFTERMNAGARQTQSFQYVKQQAVAAPRPPAPAPASASSVPTQMVGTIGNPANRSEKPYVYKPKEPARPNVMWGVDPQALATQKSFINQVDRRNSLFGHSPQSQVPPFEATPPQPQPFQPQYTYDPTRDNQPLRPFSRDQYYSTERLPAAVPGEYSAFMQSARRESQGAQGLQRPGSQPSGYVPNYQSVSNLKRDMKQGSAPTAAMMGGPQPSHMPPNPYVSSSSRPSTSTHSEQSPPGAPLTPATSTSSASKSPETQPGFLENVQKYPYLLNSFLRRKKVYESPYALGDGYTSAWQPSQLDKPAEERESTAAHTPSASMSSVAGAIKENSQWTPPSQVWHASGLTKDKTPPRPIEPQQPMLHHNPLFNNQQQQKPKYPPPTYQTAQEFQQSCMGMPSTASRDGAQARAARDQMGGYGYGPFAPHAYAPQPRNSFGHAYDKSNLWQQRSPKQPTPSPLSDPNTPGHTNGFNQYAQQTTPSGPPNHHWGQIPMRQGPAPPAQMMNAAANAGANAGAGWGPTLPQMGGGHHETWRYGG